MFNPVEYFSFIISPVTFKDLTLKNLTMQDGSTFPYWVQRVGQDITQFSPQRAYGVGEVPLSTTTQILGRRNNPQSRFPAWVESGTFQKKQNKTNYSRILKREHQGIDKHVLKEYQIIDIFNLFLHVSLKQWRPLECIFTILCYPIHSPGIKYTYTQMTPSSSPELTPMLQTQYIELLDGMVHWMSFRHLETQAQNWTWNPSPISFSS